MSAIKIGNRIALLFTLSAALAGCGNSDSMTPTEPSPVNMPSSANLVITINGLDGNMSFSPATASIRVGQTVAWHNADSITHSIAQDGGAFATGTIAGGATSAPVTISSAGTLPYHCTIHPSMTGSLTAQ